MRTLSFDQKCSFYWRTWCFVTARLSSPFLPLFFRVMIVGFLEPYFDSRKLMREEISLLPYDEVHMLKSLFPSPQKKPYSAITVQVDRLTSGQYDADDMSGIVDLIEVIRLQSGGPTEAARAIRKKLCVFAV